LFCILQFTPYEPTGLCSIPERHYLSLSRAIFSVTSFKTLRLARECPHDIIGFQTRLAAKECLHYCCAWFHGLLERVPLTFAELIDWEMRFHISHQTF